MFPRKMFGLPVAMQLLQQRRSDHQ